ncbi:UvrD-helicase domain-containing protein [Rothia mucilaginosa]
MIPQEDWKPADGLILEPNAYEVVRSSKNVVVSAGPGAGKTELLAQRADFLLRTGSCRYPQRILAISFKVDAARNLDERVRKRSGGIYSARFDSMTFDAFSKMIVDNYRAVLSGEYRLGDNYEIDGSLDDNDLCPNRTNYNQLKKRAIKIIESNSYVLWSLRQTYSHIFIDEFQDTTKIQYCLVRKIFRESNSVVTAVGDEKQKIMVWAGAMEGIIDKFQTDFNANKISLYRNFRSLPKLQRIQQNIARVLDSNSASTTNAVVGDGGALRVQPYGSDVEEAEAISGMIREWIESGTSPDEIAVLVRQQPEFITIPLVEELQEMNIAYCDASKMENLLKEPIAVVAFNFLRLVVCPPNSEAYIVLKQFAEHVSATDAIAQKTTNGLNELIDSAEKYISSEEFESSNVDAWKFLFDKLWMLFPDSLFQSISDNYQQEDYIRKCKEKVYELFFEELRVDGNPSKALSRLSGEGAVKILTIHKSKGLEFEKVILLGVENQLFWSKSSDFLEGTRIPKEVLYTFFVAVSRAKHELVLTSVQKRNKPRGFTKCWVDKRTSYVELLHFVQGV